MALQLCGSVHACIYTRHLRRHTRSLPENYLQKKPTRGTSAVQCPCTNCQCGLTYAYESNPEYVILSKNLFVTTAAARQFVYDEKNHHLVAFPTKLKSYGLVCPSGQKCVMKNVENKSEVTLFGGVISQAVGWGSGLTFQGGKFTMCMESGIGRVFPCYVQD